MNKEQPMGEVSGTVSEESLNFDAAEITNGSLTKFKDVKSLEEAYINLQSEFTRKCQKLSELEKENSNLKEVENKTTEQKLEPFYEKAEWNDYVKQFLKDNDSAKNYATDDSDIGVVLLVEVPDMNRLYVDTTDMYDGIGEIIRGIETPHYYNNDT